MTKQRRYRESPVVEPAHGRDRSDQGDRADRWEDKRRRFADQRADPTRPRPLSTTFYVTIGGILLAVIFVVMMTARNTGPSAASGPALQQVPATTAATEGGRISISADEVATKKLVAWDYQQGNTTVPLLAYTAPSGAVKIATRMCEPCNSRSFRIEGNQLVCNLCGSRWDLETSKGISGGCQLYPPELMPTVVDGGRISVDEKKIAAWQPRV